MEKLRVSWSSLDLWSHGRKDDAINAIIHGDKQLSFSREDALVEGSDMHKEIADNKLMLYPFMEGGIFEDDEGTNKWTIELDEWLQVSFIVDYLNDNYFIDWKSGMGKKMQLYVYAFLLDTLGLKMDYGIMALIYKENGKMYGGDYSIFKINDAKKEMAQEFIFTIAGEMYNEIPQLLNIK